MTISHGVELSISLEIPTVTGVFDASLVKIRGYRYWPQPVKKERAKDVPIPGIASGMTIERSVLIRLAPSIYAASSNEYGIVSKKLLIRRIGKAIDVARTVITTAVYVLYLQMYLMQDQFLSPYHVILDTT